MTGFSEEYTDASVQHHNLSAEHDKVAAPTLYDKLLSRADERAEFIRTPGAEAFIGAVERAGLTLSHTTKDELSRESDRRYGNGYAWLSRVAAMSVAGRFEAGQEIFEEPEEEWSSELQDWTKDKVDVSGLKLTGDGAADMVIDLLEQVAERDASGDHESDIPVAGKPEHFKRYGCKDVEVYFAQALSNFTDRDALQSITIGDKQFWHKKHGGPTYLNLEPLQYNGVLLPPGCVFRREEDGGYLFLRVTGFAFKQNEAEATFGTAITGYYDAKDGREDVDAVFTAFEKARKSSMSSASDSPAV